MSQKFEGQAPIFREKSDSPELSRIIHPLLAHIIHPLLCNGNVRGSKVGLLGESIKSEEGFFGKDLVTSTKAITSQNGSCM